jgi:hypothetical protein
MAADHVATRGEVTHLRPGDEPRPAEIVGGDEKVTPPPRPLPRPLEQVADAGGGARATVVEGE